MKPISLLRSILLVICLGLSASGRLFADGFPLPLNNGGTWGNSPAGLATSIETALKDSGFLKAVGTAGQIADGLAKGKVPAIEDLAGVVEGDVQQRVQDAVDQATDATRLLAMIDVKALQQLFESLQSNLATSQQFAFTIPGGRLVVRRDLLDVSLCAVIAGPGGARVTLGMSNGKQLCSNPAERFLNPTREPMLFADFAVGLAHVQARRKLLAPPVPGPDPALSIQAAVYFKIHDDWVQLRLAGNDPQSLSLKLQFVVGVKAGFSDELQAEVEGQIILEVGVNPTQVASLLQDIGNILKRRLGNSSPSSAEAAPALAASVFQEIFTYLQTFKDRGEPLGELALRFAADGGVGVGIWDTGINGASVGAELTLSVPLEAVVSLSGDLLATQFQTGLEMSTHMISLFEAMCEGRLTDTELHRQLGLAGHTAEGFAQSMLSSYSKYLRDIEVHYQMGLYALGDIGQVADQTIPLLIVGADMPIGKILVNGIHDIPRFARGVTETAKALVWTAQTTISAGLNSVDRLSLGKIVAPPIHPGGFVQRPRGTPPIPLTPAQWEAMATELLDDVEFSVQLGVITIEGASLGNWVRLAGGATEVTSSLLNGAIRSALNANEKPLLDALRAAPSQIGSEAKDLLIFNLQKLSIAIKASLGASGTIGAEVNAGVGASIGFEARIKASLILLALGLDAYDEEDETVLAGIDFPMEASVSAGVSLGEAVEFSAEGGVTAGVSLANLTLKDWGQDLPLPAGLTIAGFEVIDFDGVNRPDGSVEGKGWIVLPMGGLVRADAFSLNSAGNLLKENWSGILELGPLGELSIASGTITGSGLVGHSQLAIGPGLLMSNFRLQSNGLLFGNASGNFYLAGIAMTDVQLSLMPDGSFSGTTIVKAFEQPMRFNLAITPGGGLTGSTLAKLHTPWGIDLDTDLKLDATGVHGAGVTRILGSEFRSTNLRVQANGRLTGSFTGVIPVHGQVLTLQDLQIFEDKLQGRTTLAIAGHPAVELRVDVRENGVVGTFVSDLNLFNGGRAHAWVRITDEVEILGEMDRDFMGALETQVRGRLLAGISGAQELLRGEQEKLAGYRADVEKFDRILEDLRRSIVEEKTGAKAAAEATVQFAQATFQKANHELDRAIADLAAVSGQLAAELERASSVFRTASTALAVARGGVDTINRDIGSLDRWYNSLDPVAKAFHFLGYHARRGIMLIARDAAIVTLAGAQRALNDADAALKKVQQQLANTNLVAIKTAKELAVADAEEKLENAVRDLNGILAILADPALDPRYLAVAGAREAVLLLIHGAEIVIKQTTAALGDASELIDYIHHNGEASAVRIQRIHFRSKLAELNAGFVQLVVDALVGRQPRRFVLNYNFKSGVNDDRLAAVARELSPTLYPESEWTMTSWVDDASTGLNPGSTLWAYHFNSEVPATVNAVSVPGLSGISPSVAGRFSVQGFAATFAGDGNVLTSGSEGSATLAADFLYGANPGTITFEGLTPGRLYRATLLSVGFDDEPTTRRITFSSPAGSQSVEQNTYGNNHGVRIDHRFKATATTHVVTLTPEAAATFHLYALALSVEGSSPTMTFADWQQDTFGGDTIQPALADPNADPDGDGIPNFLEYAQGTNPLVADPARFGLPAAVKLPGGAEARQFVLPYQPTAEDVIYRIRQSSDLITWKDTFRLNLATGEISQLPGVSGVLNAEGRTMTVTITDLGLFSPPSFWSLAVEKP